MFVDTSALYAVLDGDDAEHGRAGGTWVELVEGRHRLQTTNYVLVETTALLQSRIGMDGVRALTADILPVMEIFWIDEGVHRFALHALLLSGRRQLSLVDCASFEAMRRLHLTDVFCFDPHFAEQGFRCLPA